jgi:hypothetical protein
VPDLSDVELRALADRATPLPWSAADEHGLMAGATPAWCVSRDNAETGEWMYDVAYGCGRNEEADARYIAAACSSVPALLDRLAAAEAALADSRQNRTIVNIPSDPASEYVKRLESELYSARVRAAAAEAALAALTHQEEQ